MPPGGGGADARPEVDATPGGDAGISDAAPDSDAPVDVEGPVVEILDPTAPAAGDFSSEAILTGDSLTITCRVTANPSSGVAVDGASVRVGVSASGELREVSATPSGEADVFSGTVSLADLPNGAITARCSAADATEEMLQNSDTVATYLDNGPRVQILAPLDGSSYASATSIAFTVTAAPVAMADTGAEPDLDAVEVRIAGVLVPNVMRTGSTFTADLSFDDPVFDPTLDGPQTLVVRAPNTRATEPVVREASVDFIVDSQGPSIAIVSPSPGELVSGSLTISANISDPAGILANSTVATIAGTHQVALAPVGGGAYEGTFDTRLLGLDMVFPNIIVRARDTTSNQSSSGFVVTLDNVGPTASLDSADLREARLEDGNLICSELFDPLGGDAVDDGQSVPQLFELRARVEDHGNGASSTSGVFIPYAGVVGDAVDLYLLDDEGGALVVDTDGDGVCDDINPLLVPTSVPGASDEVARIDLASVASSGASDFLETTTFGGAPYESGCTEGTATTPQSPLCFGTEASRVIGTEADGAPVIYSIPPLGGQQCMGNAVDAVATNLGDGWACAAVRATDELGNRGVSAPLRLCIDADLDGAEGCPAVDTVAPLVDRPDCTGTYDGATDTVDADAGCTLPPDFELELRRI